MKKYIIYAVILIIVMIVTIIITKHKVLSSLPVEETRIEDSLRVVNDSIKENINILESFKHEEIKKVFDIDNDSSLKLFHDLVTR